MQQSHSSRYHVISVVILRCAQKCCVGVFYVSINWCSSVYYYQGITESEGYDRCFIFLCLFTGFFHVVLSKIDPSVLNK